jgi:hypothetical protein
MLCTVYDCGCGGQAGRRSEAGIFFGAVVLEVREGSKRGRLKLQRIWTIELGNGKITNKPPDLPTSLWPLVICMRIEEEFPCVETWGVKIFEIGTRFCRSTDILNLDIVQEIIEKWFTVLTSSGI